MGVASTGRSGYGLLTRSSLVYRAGLLVGLPSYLSLASLAIIALPTSNDDTTADLDKSGNAASHRERTASESGHCAQVVLTLHPSCSAIGHLSACVLSPSSLPLAPLRLPSTALLPHLRPSRAPSSCSLRPATLHVQTTASSAHAWPSTAASPLTTSQTKRPDRRHPDPDDHQLRSRPRPRPQPRPSERQPTTSASTTVTAAKGRFRYLILDSGSYPLPSRHHPPPTFEPLFRQQTAKVTLSLYPPPSVSPYDLDSTSAGSL
ncbi:uncharacterized protein PSFLO_01425 [Pseudozyma flocculosa]|uniref:Uncharacterized protein n=1 Tax=Pseudozyma flocculosa TaxID=84751 RepID=A0A5C3EUD5_9BASI|nr:uncharacterized protein PSFLO_01425 [Pseudozyma flocculosa]